MPLADGINTLRVGILFHLYRLGVDMVPKDPDRSGSGASQEGGLRPLSDKPVSQPPSEKADHTGVNPERLFRMSPTYSGSRTALRSTITRRCCFRSASIGRLTTTRAGLGGPPRPCQSN